MKEVALHEICDLLNGYAFKSNDYIDFSNTLNCRMSNIRPEGYFDIEYAKKYLPDNYVNKYSSFLLNDGDLVIAMTDMANDPKILGVPTIVKTNGYKLLLNQRVGKLIILDKEKVHIPYLQYSLNRTSVKKYYTQFAGGGLQLNVGKKEILSVKIPLPPLATQQKIAAILDAADELRQKDKALVAKYDELTQALFLDMFGDPVTNPKGYLKSAVGNECQVKGGKRLPKDDSLVSENTGFPYIKAGNIKAGKVTTKNLEYLQPETREKLKRYTVNEGDVCITVVGANIGDIGVVPKELHLANLTENANKLLINNPNTLNSIYLANYLQMDFSQKHIGQKTMTVGVPKLALFRIQQLELLLPPIKSQIKFADCVKAIEEQKRIAQASALKSEELFNSLLQKAFNGEF